MGIMSYGLAWLCFTFCPLNCNDCAACGAVKVRVRVEMADAIFVLNWARECRRRYFGGGGGGHGLVSILVAQSTKR